MEPAVVVGGFGGEEVGDFGVRQDQEFFFGQALHHALGDVFDGDGVRLQELMDRVTCVEHVGVDAGGAQAGDSNAGAAMVDRQPFGERDRRVLGHGVRRGTNLGQQPAGRGRLQEVAVTASQHARQGGSRGVDVRHDVQIPEMLPVGVGRFGSPFDCRSGVGTKQIDAAPTLFGELHQMLHVSFVADISGDRDAGNFLGDFLGRIGIQAGDDQAAWTVLSEALAECSTDTVASAGDDDDFVGELHGIVSRRK